MTLINRAYTPNDQWNPELGDTYCCWQIPTFDSDWQVKLGEVLLGKNSTWCITSIDGVGLPSMRVTDKPNTFLHGQSALGDFAGSRSVKIEVTGKFGTPALAWEALRELAGAWQPMVWDQPLKFRMTGDKTLFLIGHPRRLAENTEAIRRGIVSATLEFVADDPRFYDSAVTRYQIALDPAQDAQGFCFTTNNFCLTTGTGVCIPRGTHGSRQMVNEGNARVAPIIVAVGNVTNLRAENARTGQWWEWEGTTGGGELWVDHLARTVKLDGVERYDELKVGSQFWWLDPGQSLVNIRVDSGTGYVETRYRSPWF